MRVSTADYEIHVKGRLSEQLLAAFDGWTRACSRLRRCCAGRCSTRPLCYGLLDRVQELGLELVEVSRVPAR